MIRNRASSLRSVYFLPTLVFLAIISFLAGALSGCVPNKGVPVTGKNEEDPTWVSTQSETAVNVSNVPGRKTIITITYNDETGNDKTILYTSTTRKILKGASQLGWSYSLDMGKSWTYGGKVLPPDGWAALWGDPAITSPFSDQRYVFISSLAIPANKMPAEGIDGPVHSYLGGACIARSLDGGISFKNYQCLTNQQHFYDGGSMAAAGGYYYDRRVFAAYVDVNTDQIDVWAAPDENSQFKLLPPPFPGMKIYSHPRLRFSRFNGYLYVAAQRDNGVIYINRLHDTTWETPVPASNASAINPDIKLSDRLLRTGPQFSFDVGAPSVNENDDIRFLYTAYDEKTGHHYVRGSVCPADIQKGCKDAPEWGTTPGNFKMEPSDQFNPTVSAFGGFFTIPPVWKAAYISRQHDPNGNKVSLQQSTLAVLPNGVRLFLPLDLIGSRLVCPDNRGYWGDYDEMKFAGFPPNSTTAQFVLPFSDSSQGCTKMWDFTSEHLHVSSVIFH